MKEMNRSEREKRKQKEVPCYLSSKVSSKMVRWLFWHHDFKPSIKQLAAQAGMSNRERQTYH